MKPKNFNELIKSIEQARKINEKKTKEQLCTICEEKMLDYGDYYKCLKCKRIKTKEEK